jgi:HlyD family secretion protein
MDGKVSWISDEAEFTPKNVQTKEARADLVYAIKITIPNPGKILKVGMPVSVKIR